MEKLDKKGHIERIEFLLRELNCSQEEREQLKNILKGLKEDEHNLQECLVRDLKAAAKRDHSMAIFCVEYMVNDYVLQVPSEKLDCLQTIINQQPYTLDAYEAQNQ